MSNVSAPVTEEDKLEEIRASVEEFLTRLRIEDLVEALHDELDAWKARLDELRVQTSLGRMELRERLEPSFERVELRIERVRRDIDDLAHGRVIDVDGFEESVRQAMKGLRRDIDEAEELR